MKIKPIFTDEEMARSLIEELENLSEEEWKMFDEMSKPVESGNSEN